MILFLIIVLSVVLVLDCAVLVFLVLMQLPKKEAGAGLAFGGAATDALFGAGSGNFLTKATKYTAGLFFVLAVLLSLLQSWKAHQPGSDFLKKVNQTQQQPTIAAPPAATAPPPVTTPQPAATMPTTNLLVVPSSESMPTSVPSNAAPTNPAPQK